MQFLRAENSSVMVNNFTLFKQVNPPQTGGIGQADFLCQFIIMQAAILLQGTQNPDINIVQRFLFWHQAVIGATELSSHDTAFTGKDRRAAAFCDG